jgi:hypothetical protein
MAKLQHHDSVKALRKVVAPRKAVGWFIRKNVWALGYWEAGQRIELARGEDTRRVFAQAVRAFKQEVV